MTEADELVAVLRRAADLGMVTMQDFAAAFENVDWVALARIDVGDESHGMTIDELLDDVDSALADHKGDQ